MSIINKKVKDFIKKHFSSEQIANIRFVYKYWSRINWIKTFWFNFKILPFKDAIRLPFILAYGVTIKRTGTIKLNTRPSFGIIRLGIAQLITDMTSERLVVSNKGTIIFNGEFRSHKGAKINVRKGILSFGNRINIGNRTRIVCTKSIKIGNDFISSWDCQFYDTDFHFLHNIVKDKYYPRSKEIIIGDNVFVGNHCTIGKGTVITSGSVISCCTKISGNFGGEGDNLLIMGYPGRVVKKGFEMINCWTIDKENEIARALNE